MKPPRVYFFTCEEEDNFQSDIIPIAEGLEEMGLPFHSRSNYWRRSARPDDFLFRATPEVAPESCDVVVFPFNWFCWRRLHQPEVRREFPELLTRKNRSFRTVLIDDLDGYETVSWEPAFRQFDVILRTKFNRRADQPENMRPWAIGVSQRMISATADSVPFSDRRQAIFVSYNASHPYAHTSRTAALNRLHPRISAVLPVYSPPFTDIETPPGDEYDRLMWRQTNRRHSAVYFERLKSVAACSAFCGEIVPPFPRRSPQVFLRDGRLTRLIQRLCRAGGRLSREHDRLISGDSFRFWETFAAGTVAFNVDLERYGAALPVMPKPWEHYVGVDFDRLDETADRLRDDPGILGRIAENGRSWALEHYSPAAQARRLLTECGFSLS